MKKEYRTMGRKSNSKIREIADGVVRLELPAAPSSTRMGEDEQVAIHHEERGPYRDEP